MASTLLPRITAVPTTAALLVVVGCQKQAIVNPNANAKAADLATLMALLLTAPTSAANPSNAAKIALGRTLFWDPMLSGGRDVSCAKYHNDPMLSDYRPAPSTNPHMAGSQRDPLFPARVADAPAIITSLGSLTAASYNRNVPVTVPSSLPVGGNMQ